MISAQTLTAIVVALLGGLAHHIAVRMGWLPNPAPRLPAAGGSTPAQPPAPVPPAASAPTLAQELAALLRPTLQRIEVSLGMLGLPAAPPTPAAAGSQPTQIPVPVHLVPSVSVAGQQPSPPAAPGAAT